MDTPGWYVLAISSSGKSVFATLGPYVTRALAEQKAREARVICYRVERAADDVPGASRYVHSGGRVSASPTPGN